MRSRRGYRTQITFWIMLAFGLVVAGMAVVSVLGQGIAVLNISGESSARVALRDFRGQVDNGCETGLDEPKDITITFHDTDHVEMESPTRYKAVLEGGSVTVDVFSCDSVTICQEPASSSDCTSGGQLPGGSKIDVRLIYSGDDVEIKEVQ